MMIKLNCPLRLLSQLLFISARFFVIWGSQKLTQHLFGIVNMHEMNEDYLSAVENEKKNTLLIQPFISFPVDSR